MSELRPVDPVEEVSDALEAHVRKFFADREVCRAAVGARTLQRLPRLRMLEVRPASSGDLWTYLSVGAWMVEPTSGPRLEFLLQAAEPSDRALLLVQMAAYYHANEDPSFQLGHGHTVPLGEPWLDNSVCTHFLLSTPYPLGPSLEVFDRENVHVHFYWLLPISESERQFKITHGLEALEQWFDDARLEYWKIDRASIV